MCSILNQIRLLVLLLVMITGIGCVKERNGGGETPDAISVNIAMRAGDQTPSAARFIVLNGDKITLNQVLSSTDNMFSIRLTTGNYRLIIIANEPTSITQVLNAANSSNDLEKVEITGSFREEDAIYMSDHQITVTTVSGSGGTLQGLISVDGNQATSRPEISLPRIHAKTTLYLRKYTRLNALPDDRITIKKVTLRHLPTCGFLLPQVYGKTDFAEQVLYEDNSGIVLDSDVTETQYQVKNNAEQGGYSSVVAAIPSATSPSNLFTEYLLTHPTQVADAANLHIVASYLSKGTTTSLTYTVPLRANETEEYYNLLRNRNYTVYLTLTQKGEYDGFEVSYTLKDWEGRAVNVDLNKDAFLDITNVNVNAYDAAATRVYFYTNQPADKVYISPMGSLATAAGNSFNVKEVYHKLVTQIDPSGSVVEPADNFHYTFNPQTGVGSGYFDIINLNTTQAGTQTRIIHLRSGNLERSITVNSIVSDEAAKCNTTPYIGTFHRTDERSERLVTWHSTGEWKAVIMETPAGLAHSQLALDRLASPAYGNGLYTTQNPMESEGAEVSDGTTLIQGLRTISGYGRVYFRVGWKDYPMNKTANRYAMIKVSYDNLAKETILYCRQGEEPEELVTGSAILMSNYNVALPDKFTPYPSMAGYFYQWNDRTPYSPIGSVSQYGATRYPNFTEERSVCPDKYGYPNQNDINKLNNVLAAMKTHWGYYADGYFDRRAINSHAVNSSGVNVAYAGNLFYNYQNGKSVFTPTSGFRNQAGVYQPFITTDNILQSGFWADFMPQEGVDKAVFVLQYSNEQQTSQVSSQDKLWGMNVRCVRLAGNTLFFDANGGDQSPRSVTLPQGSIISIPEAPATARSQWHMCISWNTRSDGHGTVYKFGSNKAIGAADETLYAQWEPMENLRLGKPSLEGGSLIPDSDIATVSYNQWVPLDDTHYRSSVQEAMEQEPAYPYLQISDIKDINTSWKGAHEYCEKMLPTGEWRLPRASELTWIYQYNPALLTPTNRAFPIASGTEVDDDFFWGVVSQNPYSGTPGTLIKDNNFTKKTYSNITFRCVREIRPLK